MFKIRFVERHLKPLAWRKLSTEAETQWQQPTGENTGIHIYNCVARRKVPIIMTNANYISWYSCGPTVYDAAHIGHASSYVKLDILQRILREYFRYNVVTAMNITDIDDKIIIRSQQENVPFEEISKKYETEFWHEMKMLNVKEPNLKVRVSENMPKIIRFIEEIKAKDLAYIGHDNSVYFNVKNYKYYGKLQNLNLEEDAKFITSSNHLPAKLNAADFALWKATTNKKEPHFQSPWGPGRPGWHIECSALASMIFGNKIDIHAGGLDLRFPHHENEEAQSCVHYNCQQWVNYWLHTGPLSLKGQKNKMSKSLKNTISIADMLRQYTADEFRMACLLSNYKNNMEYGNDVMQLASNTLHKFISFKSDCQAYLEGLKLPTAHINDADLWQNLNAAKTQLDACLRDDFDTARAVGVLLEFTSSVSSCINGNSINNKEANKVASSLHTIAAANNFVQNALKTFGFQYVLVTKEHSSQENMYSHEEQIDVPTLLNDLLKSRKEIREIAIASKNTNLFKMCDNIRNLIQKHGIEIKDHAQGSTFKFLAKKRTA